MTTEGVGFYDIPWPVLEDVTSLRALSYGNLMAFLAHLDRPRCRGKSLKTRIVSDLLLWHPDKFNQKFMEKVKLEDREAVSEGVDIVARFLIGLSDCEVA
ncbi:hypothetical protein DFP72DRAFT_810484 [Ephemerocybe angulata]|uniref:Uncharacterized protein n=1 Tax=Ephemerocybe angulata TaxID=980116 RepID=A0A8H6HZT7_9AGAR|nr:hypothetical protein DFP72DRAFT_822182 [Tulosesus angulatus]KAF6756298.1 hypothetical protein DFP72DRAFT_810484 [Tulosesus angulatus]